MSKNNKNDSAEPRTFTSVLSKATSKAKPDASKLIVKNSTEISNKAFDNPQLSLFQTFFTTTGIETSDTNSIEFWDTIPKYHVSQQAMNKQRKTNGNGQLKLLEFTYDFRGREMKAKIYPATISAVDKDGNDDTKHYYPSANEELVEEALRKIASDKKLFSGFYEEKQRSGVMFTLNQVREELKLKGHARTCAQIVMSINILSLSIIEIVDVANGKRKGGFTRSAYFPNIATVTRDIYKADPYAKWYVEFHPLVTLAIDTLAYRQLDYDILMKFKTQLGRWLHRWLSNKFTQASVTKQFKIHYKTIKVSSKLLDGYEHERQAIKATNEAMQELVDLGIALKVVKTFTYGKFNKIEEIIYTIYPTVRFIKQTIAANARHKAQLKQLTLSAKN